MKVYRGRGLGDFYYQLLRDILSDGREIVVRGLRRRELTEPVALIYEEPGYCWMTILGRKFNPFFALAEMVWMWSGRSDVEWISYFNNNMRFFQDGDNPDFHGAYGKRVRRWGQLSTYALPDIFHPTGMVQDGIDQIQQVVRKIVQDPFTTQAVISLWDPYLDNLIKSKDYPCNNVIYFSLRDGRLDMTVVIRSNDVVWGQPFNAIQFTHLLALVTGMLNDAFPRDGKGNVQMGKITYVVQNIHFYRDLYLETLRVLLETAEKTYVPSREKPFPYSPGPGAQKHFFFSEVSDSGFKLCGKKVFEEKGLAHVPDNSIEGFFVEESNPYWSGVVPKMIWLYRAIKGEQISAEEAASLLFSLDEPFLGLAIDFYSQSKRPFVQEMISCLKGKIQVQL